MSFKSGFVSIVGRPNVGKSTLLNQILKTKLAIMSDVAQTTRNTIQGIYTDDEAQIIFMDTPGIHKPQDGVEKKPGGLPYDKSRQRIKRSYHKIKIRRFVT